MKFRKIILDLPQKSSLIFETRNYQNFLQNYQNFLQNKRCPTPFIRERNGELGVAGTRSNGSRFSPATGFR